MAAVSLTAVYIHVNGEKTYSLSKNEALLNKIIIIINKNVLKIPYC